MPDRVTTSFIPKASLKDERRRVSKNSPIGIINVIATVILIAAIIAAAGIFLFERFTIENIERKRASLERAREAFEPATIRELSRLDTRLDVGLTLLNEHPAPSVIFDELETITLDSVRFENFSYGETAPGQITVTMEGEASSFNALALQSDAFGESEIFEEPIFGNLNLSATGNVVFSFVATVNLSRIRYNPGSEPVPEVTL